MSTLIDSYSETNRNDQIQLYSGSNPSKIAQSFTGVPANITSCKFYLLKSGLPTGNAVAKLYAHSGVYGTGGLPTGTALATSDNYDVSGLTGSYQLIEFTFSGIEQYAMTNAYYCISIEYSGGGVLDFIRVGLDSSAPTASGNWSYFMNGTTWTAVTVLDVCFYVYGNLATSKITGVSTIQGISQITL